MRNRIMNALGIFSVVVASGLAVAGVAAAGETKGEYSGYCAYGLAKGMDIPTNCSITWQDPSTSKTYCFSTAAAKSAWAADPRGNLARAETGYHAALMKAQAKNQAEQAKQQALEQGIAAEKMAAQAQSDAAKSMGDAQKSLGDAKKQMEDVNRAMNIPVPPPAGK